MCVFCFLFFIVSLVHLGQLAVSGETGSAPRGKTQRSRVAPQTLTIPKTESKPYTLVNNRGSPKSKHQEFKFPPPPIHKPSEGISSLLNVINIINSLIIQGFPVCCVNGHMYTTQGGCYNYFAFFNLF